MALVTPEYLQTKKYRALRDRLVLQHGGMIQPGVWDAGDFKVTQRLAGANGSVDVAAGFALVQASDPGNRGLYHAENDASLNVTTGFGAGHATLPRLDQIVLTLNDTTDGADATDVPTLTIVQGVATAGATLDNRNGAAALPASSLRLADVLMPAAASTITTANIRDRRLWARGAFVRKIGSRTGSTYSNATNTLADIDATNLSARIECSGVPLLFDLDVDITLTAGTGVIEVVEDGLVIPSAQVLKSISSDSAFMHFAHLPAAGTHMYKLQFRCSGGTFGILNQTSIAGTSAPVWTISEMPRQNSDNG